MRFFLCLFYMFHHRYSNCRPLNSARYNRIICQRVENTSFFERLSCILHIVTRLPRLQIQFRISRSFRPRNLANLGSKIRFWIRRKEHTLYTSLEAAGPQEQLLNISSRVLGILKLLQCFIGSWSFFVYFIIHIIATVHCVLLLLLLLLLHLVFN